MSANAAHKSFSISAALGQFLLVQFTGTRDQVAPATAATQRIAGAIDMGADAANDMVDVPIWGVGKVRLGGTVAAGDPLTADAQSRAVVAAFAASQTRNVFGRALEPGVSGDIILYQVAPSVIAG